MTLPIVGIGLGLAHLIVLRAWLRRLRRTARTVNRSGRIVYYFHIVVSIVWQFLSESGDISSGRLTTAITIDDRVVTLGLHNTSSPGIRWF